MKFIFIDKKCFLYSLIEHDKEADIATLNLYKNIQDFKSGVILTITEIPEWSSYF